MNLIKLTIDIDINNPAQMSAFNTFIDGMRDNNGVAPVTEVTGKIANINKTETATQPASQPVTQPASQPATQSATAAEPVKTDMKKLDVIRQKMAPKLGTHREAIKKKLSDLDAPNLTELPVDKWEVFEQFIDSLA